MIRIFISKSVADLANDYRQSLKKAFNAIDKIQALAADLNDKPEFSAHVDYLNEVITKYDSIIVATPQQFETLLQNSLSLDELKKKAPNWVNKYAKEANGKRVKKRVLVETEFYKLVCEAMGYDTIRNEVYPPFAEKLGIKTCVYCNAQYGITLKKTKSEYTSTYEIDHFKPQSKFPHLCTSFFNLQPSCGHCNKLKLDKDSKFNLYTESLGPHLRPFKFSLSSRGIIPYLLTRDFKTLTFELSSYDISLLSNHEERFKVSKKYESHRDEAAELIVKSQFYNRAYLDQLRASFGSILPQFYDILLDILIGFPTNHNDVHKRPLTLMKQDIAEQLGLL